MFILDAATGCAAVFEGVTIPDALTSIISIIINAIKIVIPILLIIYGMLDLGKAVMAQKEDEIKTAQKTFTKRVIAAAVVFFVIFIVQLVVSFIASVTTDDETNANIWTCVEEFVR